MIKVSRCHEEQLNHSALVTAAAQAETDTIDFSKRPLSWLDENNMKFKP